MKKAKLSLVVFFSLTMFLAVSLLCYSTIPDETPQQQIQKQKRRPVLRTVVVSSVSPDEITLLSGGDPQTVTISGSRLGYATSAQVILDGNVFSKISATLSRTWPNPSEVTLRAQSDCPVGENYQLKLTGKTSSSNWTVSLDHLRIKVSTPQAEALKLTKQAAKPAPQQRPRTKQLAPKYQALKDRPKSRTIETSDLEKIVSSVFRGASYSANACGGEYANRKTKIQIGYYYNKEEAISRLDKNLPADVKQDTTHEAITMSGGGDIIRDKRIRACVDNLTTHPWRGFVENGKFKVRMQFRSNIFIKTRIMMEKKTWTGGWDESWKWNEDDADINIPDYLIIACCLDVYLTPVVQNGVLSYSTVDVKWFWGEDRGFYWPEGALVSDPFATPYGHPYEKAEILKYKDQVMNYLKQRIKIAFENNGVRNGLQHGLTNYMRTGEFSNRTIKEVTGRGNRITVTYK